MAKRVTHKGWIIGFSEGVIYRKADMVSYEFQYAPYHIGFSEAGEWAVPKYVRKFMEANASDYLTIEHNQSKRGF